MRKYNQIKIANLLTLIKYEIGLSDYAEALFANLLALGNWFYGCLFRKTLEKLS